MKLFLLTFLNGLTLAGLYFLVLCCVVLSLAMLPLVRTH